MKPLQLVLGLGVGAVIALSPSAFAQANGKARSADDTWQSVKSLGQLHVLTLPAHASAAARQKVYSDAITSYLSDADQLRQFSTNFPTDPRASEAKRREALALLHAGWLGDTSQKARRDQLVAEVRRDPSLPPGDREVVAATADNQAVARGPKGTRPERLTAMEQVARGLQSEFPTVEAPYESLVQLAKIGSETQAAAIAKDLLQMPAPARWKSQAQFILGRQGFEGKSLKDLATAALGASNPIAGATGPIVLYTWSTRAPGSQALAKRLSAQAPAGTQLVGVCLDAGDMTGPKATAKTAGLPGVQIYDPLGAMGRLAGRLLLFDPGMVFLADASGVIRSVSAQNDFAAALATLNP